MRRNMDEVELECAVYGEGTMFPVKVRRDAKVSALQKAIVNEKKDVNDCFKVDPATVTLYLAKKNDAWLKSDATLKPLLKQGQDNSEYVVEMIPNWKLNKPAYFGDFQLGEEEIHILVELPNQQRGVEEATSHADASSLYKRKRWESINQMIQNHKKLKPSKQGEVSIPYLDVKWNDLEPLYRSFLKPFILQPIPIAQPEVDALYSCLERFTKVFGGVFSGKESKRLFFIAPVLAYVSHLFDDVRLLVEENVDGRQVQANGRFEFVIYRGDKRVGIVEAKKDDMEQGMAQNLLGCEVLSDVEQLPIVFGIVTNYTQWIFFRSETDCIYEHDATIDLGERGMPTTKSLKKIAGMIYSLLA